MKKDVVELVICNKLFYCLFSGTWLPVARSLIYTKVTALAILLSQIWLNKFAQQFGID